MNTIRLFDFLSQAYERNIDLEGLMLRPHGHIKNITKHTKHGSPSIEVELLSGDTVNLLNSSRRVLVTSDTIKDIFES